MEKGQFRTVLIFIGVCIFFNLVGTCTSCTNKNDIRTAKTEINAEIDGFKENVYDKKEIDLIMQIDRLKSALLELYDWNAIVRTAKRPDDKMKEYMDQIDKLEKELRNYQEEKRLIEVNDTTSN